MNLVQRAKAPTPKFFKVLRNIGLAVAAVGATILAAPIALPLVVTTVGGYLAVAGGVITAVSQLTSHDAALLPPAGQSEDGERLQTSDKPETGFPPELPQDDNW